MAIRSERSEVVDLEESSWRTAEAILITTARSIRQVYDQRLAPLGLTMSEALLIAFVVDFGPAIQTRLADQLGMGRAAAGQLIDRLEKRGLVARTHHPDDRRVWVITPTDATSEMRQRIQDIGDAMRPAMRAGISPQQYRTLIQTMRRMEKNIEAMLAEGDRAEEVNGS